MTDFLQKILANQFEAALCMFNDCVEKCRPEHWDGKVGRYAFWHVAYHTLCFVDLYLATGEDAFEYRAIHAGGKHAFDDEYPSRRFEMSEIIDYVQICRNKAIDTLAAETAESLQGPSGFPGRPATRAEIHLYNLRHLQHHTGQLSAFLRRVDPEVDPRWVGTGWK